MMRRRLAKTLSLALATPPSLIFSTLFVIVPDFNLVSITVLNSKSNQLDIIRMVYTLTVHLYAKADPEAIPRLKAKLVEAARIYRKDKETIDWLVMQDVHDPRAFTIVERFATEAVSHQYLLSWV